MPTRPSRIWMLMTISSLKETIDIHMTEDAEGDKSETDGEDVILKILAAQEALSSDLSPVCRGRYGCN